MGGKFEGWAEKEVTGCFEVLLSLVWVVSPFFDCAQYIILGTLFYAEEFYVSILVSLMQTYSVHTITHATSHLLFSYSKYSLQ